MSWTKQEIKTVALRTLYLFAAAILVIEIGLQVLRPSPDQRDALLGWKMKTDYHREFAQRTLGGKKYVVSFRTNADGFRVFGTDDKAPVKLLVLGDSFTMDPDASDNRMWYAKVAERLADHAHRPLRDYYVLAAGGGGWGTYQELLLAESISRKIKPNLFVLQFCSNDFQNNSYEWESQSITRGQYMRRPYATLDGGGPFYAPGIMAAIYRSRFGRLRFFNRADSVIAGFQYKMYGGYTKPLPPDVQAKYERDSIALTRMLLTKLRQQFRDVPAVMVNCDGRNTGPNKQWKSIARDAGFIPLSGPSDFLRSLKPGERGNIYYSDGAHLADEGNQRYGTIAGDTIAALNLPSLNGKP